MFPCQQLENKHILIAITGGIAAYKVTELVRYLVTNDAEVRIIMTRAAEKFITRLTMETLSQNPVESELFPEKDYAATHHVHLADWADAVMVVPASYNMIGKLRAGIADDLVSTIMAAVHCPTVIAPAMNVHMWLNPVLQDNLKNLQKLGYLICPPEEGFLAEGYEGKGRLASLDHLIQYLYRRNNMQEPVAGLLGPIPCRNVLHAHMMRWCLDAGAFRHYRKRTLQLLSAGLSSLLHHM